MFGGITMILAYLVSQLDGVLQARQAPQTSLHMDLTRYGYTKPSSLHPHLICPLFDVILPCLPEAVRKPLRFVGA
nr:hypothetical protein BaRGS_032667 [Batillaria attramentaria]